MTDDRGARDTGRLDLRALSAVPDDARREAVIAAVLAHAAESRLELATDCARLMYARRRLTVVAAVLAGLAAASVLGRPRRAAESSPHPISTWAEAQRVPTNGELIAFFQGYAP